MKKVYYNVFHNLVVIIDEKNKTITTGKYTEANLKGCFIYPAKTTRLKEVFRYYRNSGFARA